MAESSDGNDGCVRVLLVGDIGGDASAVESCLGEVKEVDTSAARVGTLAEARGAMESERYDVVLLHLPPADSLGAETLETFVGNSAGVPVVVLVGEGEVEHGMACVRCGAADYLVTDTLTARELSHALRCATARSGLEAGLRESERQYRTLFEHAGTATIVAGEDTVIRLINERAEALLGHSRSEVEGRMSWTDLLPLEDAGRLVAHARRIHPVTPVEFETRLIHGMGGSRAVLVNVVKAPESAGLIISLLDLSVCDQAESDVRRQREYFRSLFENSPEGIVAFDGEGLVVDINPAFERLFGFKLGEMAGKSVIDFIVPPRFETGARQILHNSLAGGSYVPRAMRRRSDGSEVAVSILGASVTLDGEHAGGFGIYRDVSAQVEAQARLEEAFIDLVETTARMMESVDPYTAHHQRMVARLADVVGRRLGLDDDSLQGLYVGALLHDVGKLSLPSTILTKPGRLTPQEWALIRSHPRRGYDVLVDAKLPWPVADMALRHHERLDGSGYPDGIAGDMVSLEARILGVCDVVEAMSSDRPYRTGLPLEAVLRELSEGSGGKYDPRVVEAAKDAIQSGEFTLGVSYSV
jgi:PAS domain S-box-containing protein